MSEDAPVCRWRNSGLILDVIPLNPYILGFSNRWYRGALETATNVRLPLGLVLRIVTAPYFLGTKTEAFRGRGRNDYFASHDLEDLIAVVDGRGTAPVRWKAHLRIYANSSQRQSAGCWPTLASWMPYPDFSCLTTPIKPALAN